MDLEKGTANIVINMEICEKRYIGTDLTPASLFYCADYLQPFKPCFLINL